MSIEEAPYGIGQPFGKKLLLPGLLDKLGMQDLQRKMTAELA